MLTPPLLLLAGAAALYVAGRAAADAGGGRDSIASVVTALTVPAAAAGATAIALGHEATALGAVHGAACSTALLAGGLALLTRPNDDSRDAPDRSAAALVPIAAVVVVAGFAGTYDATAAIVTLAVGATVLAVLHHPGDPAADGPAWGRAVQILLAFAAAGGGLLLATAGADGLSAEMGWEVSRLAGTLFVGPMLALPVIGITGRLAAEGRPARAASAAVAASAATLGIVLPLVAGSAVLVRWLHGEPAAVPVPLSLWRVDTVLLLLVGLLFLPAALGRWRPGRAEGIGLVVAYVAYLTVSVAAVR